MLLFESDGDTLYIGIAEEDKIFSELQDVITIKDAFKFASAIENFTFENGDVLDTHDMMGLGMFDGDNNINGST